MDRAGVLDVMPIPELEETCRRLESSCANLKLFLSELETERSLLMRERKKYQKKLTRLGADSSVLNINRPLGNHRPFAEALIIRSLGAQLVLQTIVAPRDIESSQEIAKFSQFMARVSTESVVEEIAPITFKPRESGKSSKEIRFQRSDLSVKWGLQWEKRRFLADKERIVERIYCPSPAYSYNLRSGVPKIRKGMRLVAVNSKRFKEEIKEELATSFDVDLLFEENNSCADMSSQKKKSTYVDDLIAFRRTITEQKRVRHADVIIKQARADTIWYLQGLYFRLGNKNKTMKRPSFAELLRSYRMERVEAGNGQVSIGATHQQARRGKCVEFPAIRSTEYESYSGHMENPKAFRSSRLCIAENPVIQVSTTHRPTSAVFIDELILPLTPDDEDPEFPPLDDMTLPWGELRTSDLMREEKGRVIRQEGAAARGNGNGVHDSEGDEHPVAKLGEDGVGMPELVDRTVDSKVGDKEVDLHTAEVQTLDANGILAVKETKKEELANRMPREKASMLFDERGSSVKGEDIEDESKVRPQFDDEIPLPRKGSAMQTMREGTEGILTRIKEEEMKDRTMETGVPAELQAQCVKRILGNAGVAMEDMKEKITVPSPILSGRSISLDILPSAEPEQAGATKRPIESTRLHGATSPYASVRSREGPVASLSSSLTVRRGASAVPSDTSKEKSCDISLGSTLGIPTDGLAAPANSMRTRQKGAVLGVPSIPVDASGISAKAPASGSSQIPAQKATELAPLPSSPLSASSTAARPSPSVRAAGTRIRPTVASSTQKQLSPIRKADALHQANATKEPLDHVLDGAVIREACARSVTPPSVVDACHLSEDADPASRIVECGESTDSDLPPLIPQEEASQTEQGSQTAVRAPWCTTFHLKAPLLMHPQTNSPAGSRSPASQFGRSSASPVFSPALSSSPQNTVPKQPFSPQPRHPKACPDTTSSVADMHPKRFAPTPSCAPVVCHSDYLSSTDGGMSSRPSAGVREETRIKDTSGASEINICTPLFTLEVELSNGIGTLQFRLDDDVECLVDVFLIDHLLRPELVRNNLLSHIELMVLSDNRMSKIDLVDLLF